MNYQSILKNCKSSLASASLGAVLSIVQACNANAFTLDDAIILAHENNYKILAESQNYDATKMALPKALGGFLPTVQGTSTNSKTELQSRAAREASNRDPNIHTYGATVTQPIFNGGGTYAQVRIAQSAKKSGLARFYNVSNAITVQAVSAYEGVLSGRHIYEINVKNQDVFKQSLDYARIRFDAGVITKTDVLQAEVRYSDAQASKEKAYADMKNAEATFEQVLGAQAPADMDTIDVSHITLPSNVEELIEIAKSNNPALKSSRADYDVARYQVNTAVAQILPSVSAQAQMLRSDKKKDVFNSVDANTYTLQVQVPIFQGGGEYASIKERRHLARKADYDYRQLDREVNESAITVWNNYRTALAVVKTRTDGVTAAEQALEGVQEEVNIGTRTTIDLLNAQNELFNAKVAHRRAKSDVVVVTYQMLQVMGAMSAPDIEYLNNMAG